MKKVSKESPTALFDQQLKGFRRAAKRVRAAAKKAMKNPNGTNDTTRESIVEKLDEAIDIFAVLLPRLEKLAQSR